MDLKIIKDNKEKKEKEKKKISQSKKKKKKFSIKKEILMSIVSEKIGLRYINF
jgi:hypothetical protein